MICSGHCVVSVRIGACGSSVRIPLRCVGMEAGEKVHYQAVLDSMLLQSRPGPDGYPENGGAASGAVLAQTQIAVSAYDAKSNVDDLQTEFNLPIRIARAWNFREVALVMVHARFVQSGIKSLEDNHLQLR